MSNMNAKHYEICNNPFLPFHDPIYIEWNGTLQPVIFHKASIDPMPFVGVCCVEVSDV